MMFSTDGAAGTYKLRFACVGAGLDPAYFINVTTSVTKIDFITEPISYINAVESSVSDVLNPVIQILDSNSNGI